MSTRRTFIGMLPFAGATLLGACGSSGGPVAVEPDAGKQPESSPTVDNVPAFVVVEDWSGGAAVDAGRIDFSTLIRQDSFADANLAADCKGWSEHGPSSVSSLPALNRVQFSAKRYTIMAGGQYSQVSYRVQVFMRALDLKDGLFGDVRGVSTYPGPHKLRITNAAGTELKRIEMRDGLPMNHSSLVNVPFDWAVTARPDGIAMPTVVGNYTSRLPPDKAMRPHMSAGSTYIAFFGDTPSSSPTTQNRIPRVKAEIWPAKNSKTRAIYNGDDIHTFGGNGFNHPEIMPRWAMSDNAANAATNLSPNDPDVFLPVGYNWVAALTEGWDYEPGALGGITRRSGPGGVRPDRTVLPAEIFQMALTQSARSSDGTSTQLMARGHALNQANYPGYYPKDMLTLDAINAFSDAPQPNISGREITPILHYYGGTYQGTTREVWVCDVYGVGVDPIAQAIEFANPGTGNTRTNAGHVRNGWMPDGEHNCRVGSAWSALLYSDPMFSRMSEQMMLESSIFSPVLSRATWNLYGNSAAAMAADPGQFWQSRSNILPFCVATMMWWVATQNGIYTRATIEERFHSFFNTWKTDVLNNIPTGSTVNTASAQAFTLTGGLRVFWDTWAADNNYAAGSGWVASFGLYSMYLGHFLLLLKCSGLLSILQQNATTASCLAHLEQQLAFHGRVCAEAPWSVRIDSSGSPALILRTQLAGANGSNLSTVPSTVAEVIAHNPKPRPDGWWFLNAAATPGVSTHTLQGNYATFGRLQTAHLWWQYFAPKDSVRDAAIASLESYHASLASYIPRVYDPAFTRHNFFQTVPAF